MIANLIQGISFDPNLLCEIGTDYDGYSTFSDPSFKYSYVYAPGGLAQLNQTSYYSAANPPVTVPVGLATPLAECRTACLTNTPAPCDWAVLDTFAKYCQVYTGVPDHVTLGDSRYTTLYKGEFTS